MLFLRQFFKALRIKTSKAQIYSAAENHTTQNSQNSLVSLSIRLPAYANYNKMSLFKSKNKMRFRLKLFYRI